MGENRNMRIKSAFMFYIEFVLWQSVSDCGLNRLKPFFFSDEKEKKTSAQFIDAQFERKKKTRCSHRYEKMKKM